jgi:hypothetical protein
MGEERIRIESYDMPEGKYSRSPLSETPDYIPHEFYLAHFLSFPYEWQEECPRKVEREFLHFVFKYKRLYRHEDEGHRLYPESERREA